MWDGCPTRSATKPEFPASGRQFAIPGLPDWSLVCFWRSSRWSSRKSLDLPCAANPVGLLGLELPFFQLFKVPVLAEPFPLEPFPKGLALLLLLARPALVSPAILPRMPRCWRSSACASRCSCASRFLIF